MMKRAGVLLLFLLSLELSLHSQNKIHLLDSDSTLSFRKIRVYKGYIGYVPADSVKVMRYLRNNAIGFIEITGKYYGPSAKGFFRIKNELLSDEISKRGALDACMNYTKYKAAATGTFVTTYLAGGILGLIPALATSGTTPRLANLNMPQTENQTDEAYLKSYAKQAKSIKAQRVWKNYGFGILFVVITAVTVEIIVGGISTTQ